VAQLSLRERVVSAIVSLVLVASILLLGKSAMKPGHALDLSPDNTIYTKGDAWEPLLILICLVLLVTQVRRVLKKDSNC
jgi:hypothetical protein